MQRSAHTQLSITVTAFSRGQRKAGQSESAFLCDGTEVEKNSEDKTLN